MRTAQQAFFCQCCESNQNTFVDDHAQHGVDYATLVCLACRHVTVLRDAHAPHTVGRCFKPAVWAWG